MKKTMRTLLCLLLVIVAVANIAAPAMALSDTYEIKPGEWEDKNGIVYEYICELSGGNSSSTATMTYGGTDQMYCTNTNTIKVNYVTGTATASDSGTGMIRATAGNTFIQNGEPYTGTVKKAVATYYIRSSIQHIITLV